MGNAISGVYEHIDAEFKRVSSSESEHDYLVLDELLLIEPPPGHLVRLGHLAILYVIDRSHNGHFELQDLNAFAELGAKQEANCELGMDFTAFFQARCTVSLWKDLVAPHGVDRFVRWIGCVFAENSPFEHFEKHPGVDFINRDSIQSLHGLLDIYRSYGVDIQDFFDLMQRVAEEQSIMSLHDDTLDDVVPFTVLEGFIREFVSGFVSFMTQLGFTAAERVK